MDGLLRRVWGATPHGFHQLTDSGAVEWKTFTPNVGRRFIGNKEVWMFENRTILGDDYYAGA